MIKNLSYISLLILLFSISCKSEKEVFAEEYAAKKIKVDSTFLSIEKNFFQTKVDSIFLKNNFNGSVAIFKDSIELYRKNNGFENFKNKTKISNNTIFAIGSISKQFTAVTILYLVEQGKLRLDDKISVFLPEFQHKGFQNIPVYSLLNHTSGLDDHQLSPKSEVGKDFNYSNKGFYTLGRIIEKVSGKSLDENYRDIFQKAGLQNTFTASSFSGTHFGSAYLGNSKNPNLIDDMPKRLADKSISVAAGGILSTIDDLHQWNQSLYSGKIINPEMLKNFEKRSAERQHPIFGDMGYGYGIMMNTKNPKAFFHSGYVKGSPSLIIYYPKTKTSVIILSNIADESTGKNKIFQPHKEVKKAADKIENALSIISLN